MDKTADARGRWIGYANGVKKQEARKPINLGGRRAPLGQWPWEAASVVPATCVAGQHVVDDEGADRPFTSFAAAVACKRRSARQKRATTQLDLEKGKLGTRVIQYRGTCAPASGVESS